MNANTESTDAVEQPKGWFSKRIGKSTAASLGLALAVAGLFLPVPLAHPKDAKAFAGESGANRMLMIDPSSMPITAGKVTLTIGTLQRTNGVYFGEYKIKVNPYFFKNQKGWLAIDVSDESLAAINQGEVVTVIGTATTSGKNGRKRHIDATATPMDINRGKLKLWFTAGDTKMIFEPAYHFTESPSEK